MSRKSLAKQRKRTPLGERIDAALHYAGYKSQNELERAMFGEKSRGRISRYVTGERGQTSIDPQLFYRMANMLGVDYVWLIIGEGAMVPALQSQPPSRKEPK